MKSVVLPARGAHLELAYLHGGVVQYRPGDRLGPRVLPDYEVVLILQGNVTYVVNRANWAAPAGSMLFTRPGFRETYLWDPAGPTRHAYFHFQAKQLPSRWPNLSTWPIVRANPNPVLAPLFREVLNRIFDHPDWPARPPAQTDALVVETLLSLYIETSRERSDFERDRPPQVNLAINRMREAIDTDPHRRLALGELARTSGVSEKHLCRLFRQSLGCSPVQTHRLLCMQLALSLVARSNLSVKEIADRCGFEDPGYFSRKFTQVFGRSPLASRKHLRAGGRTPGSPLPVDLTPRLFW
jgi:AraC-like DNA-binding protein